MTYTLRYSSTRREVWQWYWRRWRERLWVVHAVVAAGAGYGLSSSHPADTRLAAWAIYAIAAFPVVVAIFAIIPQARFKPAVRTLIVGPEGWSTSIGPKSGARRWAEVSAIREDADAIVIQGTNGNALIVPQRAFRSESERNAFLHDARQWHNTAG